MENWETRRNTAAVERNESVHCPRVEPRRAVHGVRDAEAASSLVV